MCHMSWVRWPRPVTPYAHQNFLPYTTMYTITQWYILYHSFLVVLIGSTQEKTNAHKRAKEEMNSDFKLVNKTWLHWSNHLEISLMKLRLSPFQIYNGSILTCRYGKGKTINRLLLLEKWLHFFPMYNNSHENTICQGKTRDTPSAL
jgi:hypothetical protein